jgi:hypothetical protein
MSTMRLSNLFTRAPPCADLTAERAGDARFECLDNLEIAGSADVNVLPYQPALAMCLRMRPPALHAPPHTAALILPSARAPLTRAPIAVHCGLLAPLLAPFGPLHVTFLAAPTPCHSRPFSHHQPAPHRCVPFAITRPRHVRPRIPHGFRLARTLLFVHPVARSHTGGARAAHAAVCREGPRSTALGCAGVLRTDLEER